MPQRREEHHGVLKPAIDMNLPPIVNMSMAEWLDKYDELGEQRSSVKRDTFALVGQFDDDSGDLERVHKCRAGFNTRPCELHPGIQLSLLCDIDSVIGIVTDQFPLSGTATFKYYMLPDARFTLSSNLHIPGVPILDGDNEKLVPIHKIPNTRFAQIGESFLVRIFFPGIKDDYDGSDDRQSNYVGERYLQELYDLAIRPATTQILPEELRRQWPATYRDEAFRAGIVRRNAGAEGEGQQRAGPPRQQHSGREVHGADVNPWIDEIRQRVAANHELAFAQGFFFVVEGKGLKNMAGSAHNPPDGPLAAEGGPLYDEQNERTRAIETLLNDFDCARFSPDRWFIDIATSVSAKRREGGSVCLFVNREYHPEIINYFTGTPIATSARWVETGCGGYANDEEAHLGSFAGFRLDLHEPGDSDIHYLQVYTSNKSITYHLQGQQRAKRTSPIRILENWQAEHKNHFLPFQNALASASHTHSVAVRFESRIEFFSYPFVHFILPLETIMPWFFYMRNTEYWGFKCRRLASITNCLERICHPTARETLTSHELPEVGSLLILLTWMANALSNRPDDGSHWDEVRDAGCVHVNSGGHVVATRPLSIYYLHSLHLSSDTIRLPRLSSQRVLKRSTILYLCGNNYEGRTENSVIRRFHGPQSRTATTARATGAGDAHDPWDSANGSESHRVGAPHKPNRQQRITISLADDVEDVFANEVPEHTRTVRYDSEDEDPEMREAETSLSQQVTNIVYTFPVQVFGKVPNRKHGRSWCMIDEADRYDITFDIFCDKAKPLEIFTSYVDCGRDKERWDNTVRAWFPMSREIPKYAKVQGLKQLGAWQDWETILLSASPDVATTIVKATRQRINNNWRWMPWMTKNHLWATGARSNGRHKGNPNEPGGPWIIFNPKFR